MKNNALQMQIYDYAIVGGGMAGLQLVYAMLKDSFFYNKSILIIEKDDKEINDKSWSFWENGKGEWDDIVHKQWSSAHFISKDYEKLFSLQPYAYKMIRSIDFYKKVKQKIANHQNISWVKDSIQSVHKNIPIRCIGEQNTYKAKQVFDSRLNDDYKKAETPFVLQHFIGHFIKTETKIFDSNSFIMMDFSAPYKDQCSFMYVLPFDKNNALIEFTFFNSTTYEAPIYLNAIKKYMERNFGVSNYTIENTEKGVIPMSSFDFSKENNKNYLKNWHCRWMGKSIFRIFF